MNVPHHAPAVCMILTVLSTVAGGCTSSPEETPLTAKLRRFAPTELTADLSPLSEANRNALRPLILAARIMDTLYLRQRWDRNEEMLHTLAEDTSPAGRDRLRYFRINMGPWSTLDDHTAFLEGVPERKPLQASYYPADLTREEFTTWLETLSPEERARAVGFFTVIRRTDAGGLRTVPYSVEYRGELERAARLLREAARLTDNASLARFLTLRADAFLSNDYYESDIAWMELDSPVDVTIGPYEVYMDELFNYKAAFDAFITIRNEEETRNLSLYADHLQDVENALPIEDRFKNPALGAMAPIRVVDEIATGGEARAGVQVAAFNLPNDERVVTAMGSKRVMLRNVQRAKFDLILTPIADRVLDGSQRDLVSFQAFFTHILAHELMHGLGPHTVSTGGRTLSVRQAMKEISSALEEAKADVSALFALDFLTQQGVVDRQLEDSLYVTFLASSFRSVRFGITESHGRGIALIFNRMMDRGAFIADTTTGVFRVDVERARAAARELTGEIMTLQAHGDYDGARALLERDAVVRPPMQRMLDGLADIPVDIAPAFPLAGTVR